MTQLAQPLQRAKRFAVFAALTALDLSLRTMLKLLPLIVATRSLLIDSLKDQPTADGT